MTLNVEFSDEFETLREHGYICCYTFYDRDTNQYRPVGTFDSFKNGGLYPKGTKVRFTNTGGYDEQRNRARDMLKDIDILTVDCCEIGSNMSYYTFEDVKGAYNTVMFEEVPSESL